MQLDELIDRLAIRFRTGRPRADERGHFRFDLARGITLEVFLPARDRLFLEAEVRSLPAGPAEAEPVLREALARILAIIKDRPETLALDSEQNRLVLFREFKLDAIQFEEFERQLVGLLSLVESFRGVQAERVAPQPATMLIFP